MTDRTDEHPGRRDQRPPSGDGADRCVTSGAKSGTSGGFSNWRAWLAVLGLVGLNAFVNVMTALDDARRRGTQLPVTRVAVEEITSAVAATVAAFAIFAAVRLAPPGRGPLWRTIGVHAGGTLVFSGLHTALMILLRTAVFAAMRQPYAWVWGQVPYEYRKDLIAYLVIGLVVVCVAPGLAGRYPRRGPGCHCTCSTAASWRARFCSRSERGPPCRS